MFSQDNWIQRCPPEKPPECCSLSWLFLSSVLSAPLLRSFLLHPNVHVSAVGKAVTRACSPPWMLFHRPPPSSDRSPDDVAAGCSPVLLAPAVPPHPRAQPAASTVLDGCSLTSSPPGGSVSIFSLLDGPFTGRSGSHPASVRNHCGERRLPRD